MAHSMQRHRRGDQQQAMQQSNNDRRNGSSSKNKSASGQRPVSNLFDFTVNESVEKNRLNANSKYPAPEFDVLINPAFLPSPTSPAIKPTIFLDNDDNNNNNDDQSGATQFDRGSIYDQIPVSLECRDAVVSDTIASSNKSIHDSEQSNGDTNSSSVSSSLPKHVRVSRAISANQRQFPSFQLTRNVARLLPHNSIEFTDDVNNSHYHPDNGQSSEVSTRSVNSLVPMNGPSLVGQQQPNPLTKQAPYDSGTSQQQFSSQTSPHPALSDVMSTTSSLAYVTSTPTPTSNGTGSDTNNNSNNNANKPNFNVSVDDQELPLPPPPSDIILTSQHHHHHPHLQQQHSTTTSPAGSRTSCSSNDDSSADSARKSLHDDQSSLASTTTQSSIGSFQSPTGHPHHPHSNHHYSLRHYPASYQSSSTYSGSCSTLVPEEHDELNDEPRDCNRDSPESGIESPTNLPPPPPELLKALDTTDSSSGLSNAAPILPPVPVMIRTPITRPDTATLRRGAAAELQPMSHSNNSSVTTLDRRSSNGAGYAIPMQSFQTNSRTAKPMRQAPPPPPPRSGSPATSSSASGYGSSSGYATGLMLSAPPSEYSTPNMNNNSGAQTTFERPNSISLMPGAVFNNLNGNQSTNLLMSSIQQQPTNPASTVISTKSDYSTALSHAGSSPAHSVKLSPRNSATGINVDAASSNSGFDSRLPLTSLPVAGKDDLDFDQQQDTLSSPCDIVASAHHHKPSPPSMFGWVYEQKNRSQHHHNQNKSIGEGATPTSSNAQFNNDNYDPLQQQVNVFEDVRNISTNRGQSTFGGRASHIATHYHHQQQPHQLKGTYSTGHYRALNCATTDHLFDQTIMAENNNGVTNPGFVCDNNNPATSLDGIETSSSTDDDGRIKAKLSEDDTALFMDDAPSTGTSGKKNKRRGCAACCCSIFSIIRWTVIGLAAIFFIVMLFIIGFTLKERSEGVSEQDALKKIFCAVGFTKQCHHEADALNGTSIVTLQPPSTTTPAPPTTIASSILPSTESQTELDKNSEIPSTESPIQVTSSTASVPEIPPKNQLSNEPANSAESEKVQNPESITNSKVASAPVADRERGMQTEFSIENREEENFDKSKSAVSTTTSEDGKNETNSTVSTTQAMSTNQTQLSMNSEIENSDGNSLLTSSMNQNEAVNQTSDSSTVTDSSVASMSSSTTESTESPTSAQTSSTTTTTTTTTTTEQSIVMFDADKNSTAAQKSTSEDPETVITAPSMIVNNSSDPSNIETSSTTSAPIDESMNAQETSTQKTSTTQRVVNRLRSLFRSDDTKPRPLSPTVAETRSDTDETMKPAESANTQTVVKSAANKWLGKITGLFKSKEVRENNANSTSDASLSHSESGQAEKIDSGLRKTTEEMKNETNSTVAAAARSDVEKSQEAKLSETIVEIDQEPESREISNNGTSTVVEQAPPLSLTMTIKEEKKEQNNGSVAAESMAHSSSDTVLNQMMNGAVGVENQTASTNSTNSEASQETSTTNENNSQQTEFSSESATRTMKNGDTDEMIATSNSSMEQMSQSPSSNGDVSGENSTASSNNRLQVLSDVSRDSNEMSTHQSSSSTTLNSAQTQETIVKQIANDLATNKNNKNLNVNLNSEELSLTSSAVNDAVTQSNNQNSLEAVKERAESRSTQESSTVIITEKSDAMNQVSPANASDKQESDSNDSSGILLLENNNGNSDNREGEEEEKRMKNANNTSIAITETITRSNDSERTDSMLSFAIPADNSVNKSSTTAPSSWSTLLNSKKISASNNTDNAAVQHIENFKTQNSSTISTSTSAEVNSNSNNNSSSRKSRGPSVFVFDIATPQNSQNVMENNSGEVGEKFHHLTEKIVKLTEGHSIRPESRSGSVTSEQQQDKMSEQLDSTVAKQNRELATKYQSREFEVVVTGAIRSQSNDTNDAEMGAIRTMESKSVQSTNASVHRPLASSSTNSSESIKLSDKETTELSSVDADEIGSDNDMRANAGKMSKNGKFTSTHSIMSSESADNNTQKNHEVQNHESVNQESSSSSSSSSSTTLITKTVSSKSVELSTQNSLSSSETKVNQQNQELKTPMGREALESQINRITNNTITIDDNNSEVKLENSRLLTELATSALSRDEKSSVISLRSKSFVESNANNDASAATTTEMSMTFETTTMRPEDDEMDAKTTTTTTMSTIDSVTPEVVTDAMMSTIVLSEMEIDSSSASFSSPDLVMMTTTETSPLLAATTTLTPEVTTSVPTTITLDSSETTTSLPSDTPRRRTSLYSLLDS